jgi:hypothetical protein
MNALNQLSGRGHRRYSFPNGVRCVVDEEHGVHFLVGGREINKEPWVYQDIRSALSYDPDGELVIVAARLLWAPGCTPLFSEEVTEMATIASLVSEYVGVEMTADEAGEWVIQAQDNKDHKLWALSTDVQEALSAYLEDDEVPQEPEPEPDPEVTITPVDPADILLGRVKGLLFQKLGPAAYKRKADLELDELMAELDKAAAGDPAYLALEAQYLELVGDPRDTDEFWDEFQRGAEAHAQQEFEAKYCMPDEDEIQHWVDVANEQHAIGHQHILVNGTNEPVSLDSHPWFGEAHAAARVQELRCQKYVKRGSTTGPPCGPPRRNLCLKHKMHSTCSPATMSSS